MKNILGLVFLIISINVFGQNPPGYQSRKVNERIQGSFMVDSTQHIPRYCGTPSGVRGGGSVQDGAVAMDTCNNIMYMYSGGVWRKVGSESIRCGLTCADCGLVTWTGTGLNFYATPADYNLNGASYHFSGDSITLATADATYGRFDAIGLSSSGLDTVIGVASSDPQIPQFDPCEFIVLTYVFVGAGATTPTLVVDDVVFDEAAGGEWSRSTGGIITNNFTSSAQSFHGSTSALTTVWGSGAAMIFTEGGSVNTNSFNTLSFWVKLTIALATSQNLSVQFFNGTTAVSNQVAANVTKSNVSTWQGITLSPTQFTFTSQTFTAIKFFISGVGASPFYLDWVRLQSGITQAPPSTALYNAYTRITDGTNTATALGGDIFKIRTDTTLDATVANNDATHGDNIILKVDTTNVMATKWYASNGSTPTLQQVTDVGNTTDTLINADTYRVVRSATNYAELGIGSFGGFGHGALNLLGPNSSGNVVSVFPVLGLTATRTQKLQDKDGTIALLSDITDSIDANTPTLQQVTTAGNSTTNSITIKHNSGISVLDGSDQVSAALFRVSSSGGGNLDLRNTSQFKNLIYTSEAQSNNVNLMLPNTGNSTDTLATLYDVRAGGGGSSGWSLSGNSLTAGSQTGDFIGSTNNVSMRFRTNNTQRMIIDSNGTVLLNKAAAYTSGGDGLIIHGYDASAFHYGLMVEDNSNNGIFYVQNNSTINFGSFTSSVWGANSSIDITNATVNATNINHAGYAQFAEISTPSTPSSGFGRVYFKSDNLPYAVNDAGTEMALYNPKPSLNKGAFVASPTSADTIDIWQTPVAITITSLKAILRGSSSPSVTYNIGFGTNIQSPTAVFTSDITCTSITTGCSNSSGFNDATIPAGSFIWIYTTAQSGTVRSIAFTINYTED